MDSSNPIFSKDQVTVADMSQDLYADKRQDYSRIKQIIAEGKRSLAPVRPGAPVRDVPNSVISRLKNPEIDIDFTQKAILEKGKSKLKVTMEHFPHRIFKKPTRDGNILNFILSRNLDYQVECAKIVQTTGAPSGFLNRLNIWMNYKPVSVKKTCKDWALRPMEVLKQRMPLGRLKTWNGSYWDLLGEVTVTKNSSAGPPYFKNKSEVWPAIMEDLGTILEHFGKGTLGDWLGQNPIYLLAECKNKADRYRVEDLDKKCRPYFAFSAPFQLLYSFLSQTFSKALSLFHEEDECYNGYGFSFAHGGGSKILDRFKRLKRGEKTMFVYGDDVCLISRDKNGALWSVNADFSSMDASIDLDTIDIALEYLKASFVKQHGENSFWNEVIRLWKIAATESKFLVEGHQVYEKTGSLRTGVVGTTYFDTVKSVLCYEALLQSKTNIMDEKAVVKFFSKECGLEVKKNTWNVTAVDEDPQEGEFVMQDKWLGTLLRMEKGLTSLEPIPFVPPEDVAKLLTNPRYNSNYSKSRTHNQRLLLDTMRGYTFLCVHEEHIDLWNAICDAHNNADGEILTQRVQAGKGKGEKPELVQLTGETFEWPSSDGFPTLNFCKNVFLSPGNLLGDGEWIYWFPTLRKEIDLFKKTHERVQVVRMKEIQENATWSKEMEYEAALEQVSLVGQTQIKEVFDDPTALVNRIKINSKITYKKPESVEKKKSRIAGLVEDEYIESFKLDWILMSFAHYSDDFVFRTLREMGWYPHDKRIMKKIPVTTVSKEDYGNYYYLCKEFRMKSIATPNFIKAPNTNLLVEVSKNLPNESQHMDPVSRVSSAFNFVGSPLKSTNVVVKNSPGPIIEHRVYTEDGQFEKRCQAGSSKQARITLFEELLNELLNLKEIPQEVIEEEKEAIEELEENKEEEQIRPIPAPRKLRINDFASDSSSSPEEEREETQ